MATSTHETRFLLTAKDRTKAAFKSAKLNLDQVGKAVTGVHAKLLGLAGVGGMGALLTGIIDTNREMQTLKSSLKTVTGSADAAGEAFDKIQKFAVTTPFDLNQWTEAFIKMKALGLDPSEAALTSYGNTASAMGKSLNQMIEAVADAATGEFERLKEFGIKAKSEGDRVVFTFQGVSNEVGKNAAEITQYLQSIGNTQFSGAMDDQMQNLDAAFSNLRGSFGALAVKIGEAGLNDAVRDMALNITEFANSITRGDVEQTMTKIEGIFHSIAESARFIGSVGREINKLGQAFAWTYGGVPESGIQNPGLNGYRLGDFNRSGGNLNAFDQIKTLERSRDDETAKAMHENNRFQAEILEAIRNQSLGAVAG